MNVFVLCTGRSGSMTFVKACKHITNYTSAHESNTNLIGMERVRYPENHIEADNRLSYFLGRLDKFYDENTFYVHLKRDERKVANSFSKRFESGIINAYNKAILVKPSGSKKDICLDYCNSINENIDLFLKDKPNKMIFKLENYEEHFRAFWDIIGAKGDLQLALKEFKIKHNTSEIQNNKEELKSNQSTWVKVKIVAHRIINKFIKPEPKLRPIGNYIDLYSNKNKDLKFIQVGGCDGIINDPIHKYIRRDKWKGLIVEPQKDVFKNRLSKTYSKFKNIELINAAIDFDEGDKKLYKLSFTNNRWAVGLSSFLKEKLEDNINSGYVDMLAKRHNESTPETTEEYISYEMVKTVNINKLMGKMNNEIDLMVIDTEGYDFEIIKMIDFDSCKVKHILFEHSSLTFDDRIECIGLLKRQGYSLLEEKEDTLAIRNDYL